MSSPAVDVSLPVRGTTIPFDHGFALYSAISRIVPALHDHRSAGIHRIRGRPVGERRLELTTTSRLVLRLPIAEIALAIELAGRTLDLTGARITLGVPTLFPLRPSASLISSLVTIRGFQEPLPFLEAVQRQLSADGIEGWPGLILRTSTGAFEGRSTAAPGSVIRRTICIHEKNIVGFPVRIDGLTAEESFLVQERGVGGRRRFGCGVFVPARR